MPRFGRRALLLCTAVVALWLSSFSVYAPGNGIRSSILLLILVAATAAAVFRRGRRRAFWWAFVAVMVLCGGSLVQRPLGRFIPRFDLDDIPRQVAEPTGGQYVWENAVDETVHAAFSLTLATIAGFISAYVYDQSPKAK